MNLQSVAWAPWSCLLDNLESDGSTSDALVVLRYRRPSGKVELFRRLAGAMVNAWISTNQLFDAQSVQHVNMM